MMPRYGVNIRTVHTATMNALFMMRSGKAASIGLAARKVVKTLGSDEYREENYGCKETRHKARGLVSKKPRLRYL